MILTLSVSVVAAFSRQPLCFFFQAEDGIRDLIVTGVQTCALSISSRRRHTRSDRDWSSDVCSSDLVTTTGVSTIIRDARKLGLATKFGSNPYGFGEALVARSEERRVGKECRSRWSPYH